MKKFINHVDHVVFLSSIDNLDKNIADLEALTDATLVRHLREDMQTWICVDWEAGLEIVAPTEIRNDFNQGLHERLETLGEGLVAMVYGVEDLEAHKAKMEAKGMQIGPLMTDLPSAPWIEKITMRERFAPPVMNSLIVFSEIDYSDGMIQFVEVKEKVA